MLKAYKATTAVLIVVRALLPLIFLFWYIDRLSRLEMGFRWGKPTHFALALLYPLLVIGLIAIVAGTKTGALGIRDTAIFGPEIGILGLISNAVFAFLCWQWWRTRCNRT